MKRNKSAPNLQIDMSSSDQRSRPKDTDSDSHSAITSTGSLNNKNA